MEKVQLVVLFSGKRKSGKDFITGKLVDRLGSGRAQLLRISAPIKSKWAKQHGLDLNELLSDGPYKENYRKEMIEWSDKLRAEDYGVFCREAIKAADREILILSDIRRKNDIKFFKEVFDDKVRTIRVNCSDQVRSERGWIFQDGVDNVQSECDLDDFILWDLELNNESEKINQVIEKIVENLTGWLK